MVLHHDDNATLRRLGKHPLLIRSFDFMSLLGFYCSSLCPWESILLTSVPGLLIGGPSSLIWGLLLNWIGLISLGVTFAELASIAPTAEDNAVMMSPRSCSNFLSYMTAWITTLAWQGSNIMGIVQGAGILEGLILELHLAGFFGVLIPMVYLLPHNSPNHVSSVFTSFHNDGGWPLQTLAFLIAFRTLATPLQGADSAVVMPRALMCTIIINGALALTTAIAMILCIEDLDDACIWCWWTPVVFGGVAFSPGFLLDGWRYFVLSVAGGIGIYASASRTIWSFSREKGFPFAKLLSLPANAISATFIITVVIALIVLASSALYASYLIPWSLLLWRRSIGRIRPYSADSESLDYGVIWDPWRIPEQFGTLNNAFDSLHPSASTVKWSVLPFGIVLFFSIRWYLCGPKKFISRALSESSR
ncbi:amino acid transporter [Hypoxylon sp. FL0543]|nr:amino acid transporter [Hypoxylon sp. FL0543]